MTPLRAAMIKAMQVRGYSLRTHETYLSAVTDFARYHRRSPAELDVEDLRRYIEYLATERELAPATCRQSLSGIRFLYLQVLERPAFDVSVPVPKRPQRIPELLTRAEVARILAACANTKHCMMLTLCYGCGCKRSINHVLSAVL
jgi:integrase/recombinase XerD